MKAPKPKDEVQRIQVLWQYEVLDTVPEQVFDELTSLAALICGAPIALITLVDEHRQWFKSKVGTTISETNRDISMCAHAILQKDLMVVSDATKDRRFKENPLVVGEPKIRFYAGAPLVTPDGHALGTLCVVDLVPRQLTGDEHEALQLLARHVMTLLELRRQSRTRDDSRQMKKDLALALAEIARLNQAKTSGKSRKIPTSKPAKRVHR
jgi:GAF domain-containing protein